jgi:hypothetical protein
VNQRKLTSVENLVMHGKNEKGNNTFAWNND